MTALRTPIVGIPACSKMLGEYPFHAVGTKYVEAVVNAAGCVPLLLPALGERLDIERVLEVIDGVLLTGSVSNVAPERYGQSLARPDLSQDPARDATTFPLIAAALAAGLPLLGICRGFQELNVALGGSLHQQVHAQPGYLDHRADERAEFEVRYGPVHRLRLVAGGRLQAMLGGRAEIMVNSIHGQGVDRLGRGLVAEAHADDGLVEAIRVVDAGSFALAVQWHPEWKVLDNPDSMALFAAFGRACAEHAAARNTPQSHNETRMVTT